MCEEACMQSGKVPNLQSAGSEHSGSKVEAAAGLCGSDQLLIKTVHLDVPMGGRATADSSASVAFDKAANLPPTPTSFYPNPTGPWGYRCWMHLCPAQLSHHILHTQTVDINSVGAQHPPIQLPKLPLPLHLSLPLCPILRLELCLFTATDEKS